MSITKEETKHIASLSRIGMNEAEIEKFSKELSAILDWVDELKKADVSKAKDLAYVTGLKNIGREDRAGFFENKNKIVGLFPEENDGYDKVKSVL